MKEKYVIAYMQAAHVFAQLSYCKRRQVGCIVVKDDRIISIGYNGTPPGWENNCEDENNRSHPYVYHAEANAIAKLARSNESARDASVFITASPCFDCAKILAACGIKELYYGENYESTGGSTPGGLDHLRDCNIPVIYYPAPIERVEGNLVLLNPLKYMMTR